MVNKKKGKKTKKRDAGISDIIQANKGKFAILLIAIVIPLAIFGYVTFGGFFAPEAPPEELATGYARIYLVDGMSGEPINTDGIHLIFAENYTAWETDMTTGTTFYVPAGSVWWVNVSGYYPASSTLFASGSTDPNNYLNNSMNVFKRADVSDINVELHRWKNMTTGIYNYSGYLPESDGVFEIVIRMSINMPSRNTSVYGYSQWVPNYTLEEDTFARNMSLNFVTLWFGWEATLHEYTIVNDQHWRYNDVFDINVLNCTMLPTCYYDTTTYKIIGNFSNLQSLCIYDGIIDNYDNCVATLI